MNLVFKKYPILKVRFIGKDTTRNKKNISTKELILSTISKEFKNNIEFIGQIQNQEINHYLNLSRVAVFPSLFDNFPYVVLEAMAVGLHIVGSRNSGMVEILEDEPSIYNTGNYVDLANKIIEKYEISKREEVNYYNINRLKQLYNPKTVSQEMASMYSRTIKEYRDKHITEKDLEKILSKITKDTEIDSFFREKEGVANYVYQTSTKNNKYIIKKYVYNYDFDLINDMYEIYYNAGIKVAKPLNKEIIKLGDYYYNVFEYIKDANIKAVIDINYLVTLLCCERKTNKSPTLLSKTLKYYNYLKKSNHFSENLKEDIEYTVDVFERVKELDILKEKYLNHGDITLSNILISKKVNYIIDFDEATITTPLYDFAVIIIKMFTKNEIDFKKYKLLRKVLKEKYTNYKNADFDDIVRFYLCKILLEKFYLHISGKINLYSKRQLKDNFRKYIKILKGLEI